MSVSAVGWSAWKLLDQERIVEAQRAQELLEQAADQAAATLKRTLAETGDRLGAFIANPSPEDAPEDGLLLLLNGEEMSAEPAGRLLFRPFPSAEPEAPEMLFAEAELLEFQQGRLQKAAETYQRLAASPDPATRAGALLRYSRVMRNAGRYQDSRAAYVRLAGMTGVRVAGVPADLLGRHAECELTAQASATTPAAEVRTRMAALLKDLLSARWQLTRGQFEFYWREASRLAGSQGLPPAESLALSDAAALAWGQRKTEPAPRGQSIVWVDRRPFFVIWRGGPERRAVLVTRPESFLKQILAAKDVVPAVFDSEGRLLAGHKDSHNRAAVRTQDETGLPWTLYVTGVPSLTQAGMIARQRFLLLGTSVMVIFLISGTYFIARAIRREMEVSRMQSDFVSGVSHEFRSPLTSIRQLSEILLLGRVPNEDRRQVYYETLVRETARLQRLVEGLLNFGRMEAGARQYRFEELDAGALVRHVVGEFEGQIASQGRHIETMGTESRFRIDADPEAISVALRNLVDNALKYSPQHPTVWVELGREGHSVAIRVRDQGVGIAPAERKAIFRKFVRGTAATAANVKGSGVGLAMVRHIVAAHGGDITVESEPGKGSTFTMLLPASGAAA
ncbi:MAG TPA: HAMP domain-containing sensor histidine kinase [Bryobacteraceae bacterium]|nr:HAMP domain-containing sensor histidine kinase [Bryobacteraceae bacterium]